MSAAARAQIVARLNDVDGVDCYPVRPRSLAPGTAWPVWESTRLVNACDSPESWVIYVAGTAGDDQSVVETLEALMDVLAPVMFDLGTDVTVSMVEAIVTEAAAVPCLRWSVTL